MGLKHKNKYVIFSDQEAYEVLGVLSGASYNLGEPLRTEAGRWIDDIIEQAGGIDAFTIAKHRGKQLLSLLKGIAREEERSELSELNLHARTVIRYVETTVLTGGADRLKGK